LFRKALILGPDDNLRFICLKLLAFSSRLFRRRRSDETILLGMKPFSALQADVPKPSLATNEPTKRRQRGDTGRSSCRTS
jgi:hypothetical protein